MKKWFEQQWEWMKSFFDEDDKKDQNGHNPSHKNLIGIAIITVFCIAYLKKVTSTTELSDIPAGWQLVILGILGIRALQAGATAYINSKNGNGNGNGSSNPDSKTTNGAPNV